MTRPLANPSDTLTPDTTFGVEPLPPLREAVAKQAEARSKNPWGRAKIWMSVLAWFAITIGMLSAMMILPQGVHFLPGGDGVAAKFIQPFAALGALYCAVFVHEGGHALAGRLVGFRLYGLVVGPLVLKRDEQRWRLRLGLFSLGGFTFSSAVRWTSVEELRRSFRVMIAGGPLGSVVGFLAGIGIVAAATRNAAPPFPGWTAFVMLASTMSLTLAFLSLIPTRTKTGVYTDGGQLHRWRPLKTESVRERPWIPLTIALGAALRERPRDWNDEIVTMLRETSHDGDEGAVVSIYLAHVFLDRGELQAAHRALQDAIDAVGVRGRPTTTVTRAVVAFHAALFEAAWRRDSAAAYRWLKAPNPRVMNHPVLKHATDAAISWAQGDQRACERALERMRVAERDRAIVGGMLLMSATLERLTAEPSSLPRAV